jgi:hypothetical protein
MVMQEEHTGVYPGSGKRRPYVQRGGGEVCISLHRGARVGVTNMRERASSPSLKERKKGQGWLLEVSISCFSSLSVVVLHFFHPRCRTLACPFIGREEAKTTGSLEVMFLSIPVELTVATCSGNGRPSLDTMASWETRQRNDPERRAIPSFPYR